MTELLLRLFIKNNRNLQEPAARAAVGKLAGAVGIVCNVLLFGGKLAAGLLAGSIAIVADAVNNLSDASSSVVTLIGFRMAQKPADPDHPYGHARSEYLSGLAVAALILIIGAKLAETSIGKIFAPVSVEFSAVSLAVLVGSVLVKLWMQFFYRSLGKRIRSATLEATAIDSRNDVISTVAVLGGLLVGQFFRLQIDGYVGLAVAAFIIWSGCKIAKETISPLLGKQADAELVETLSQLILSHEKVLGIHDLLVHDYGPGQCFASVHAELSAEEDPLICHDIIDDIERDALEELRVNLIIHYDPVAVNDVELNYMREMVSDIVRATDPRLSLHDFRIIRGAQHKKLVFDLTIPYSMEEQRWELKHKIDDKIRAEGLEYDTVICFDRK